MNRSTLVLALLLAFPAAASEPSPDAGAAVSPPSVQVELQQVKPLRLVRWYLTKKDPGEVGLDGELKAIVTNTSAAPVRLRNLEVHGLVFRAADGAEHVVVHPCQCAQDVIEPHLRVFELAPGEKREIKLDEWGCDSLWKTPPPGKYTLEFRILPADAPLGIDPRIEPPEVVDECRRRFAEPAFWAPAFKSAPRQIVLSKPKREKVPE